MLCSQSRFFLLLADNLGHSLSLELQLLPSLQIVLPHLLKVLFKENLPLLSIFSLFSLPENLKDPLLQKIRVWVSDVNELKCVLDSNFRPTGEIIHQKLD
jgi:hypothetical protein